MLFSSGHGSVELYSSHRESLRKTTISSEATVNCQDD